MVLKYHIVVNNFEIFITLNWYKILYFTFRIIWYSKIMLKSYNLNLYIGCVKKKKKEKKEKLFNVIFIYWYDYLIYTHIL